MQNLSAPLFFIIFWAIGLLVFFILALAVREDFKFLEQWKWYLAGLCIGCVLSLLCLSLYGLSVVAVVGGVLCYRFVIPWVSKKVFGN